MQIKVNTTKAEELQQIPRIGDKVEKLIIQFGDIYGVVKRETLNLALRGNLSSEVLDVIDISEPKSSLSPIGTKDRLMGSAGELCPLKCIKTVKVTVRTKNKPLTAIAINVKTVEIKVSKTKSTF